MVGRNRASGYHGKRKVNRYRSIGALWGSADAGEARGWSGGPICSDESPSDRLAGLPSRLGG